MTLLAASSASAALITYATSATTGAGDGAAGVGSAFSNSLSHHLLDHSLTVDECFRRVSQNVIAKRRGQQPWTYSSLAQTLSFTDLPRFSATQRLSVPNPRMLGTGAWTTTSTEHRTDIVGVGDTMAWSVSAGGFKQVRHSGPDHLMGAADIGKLLLLAGSEGALYVAGAGPAPVLDLEMRHSHGLTVSPTGSGAVYCGADAVCCLKVTPEAIKIVARYKLGFGVYSCIYMPDGLIWVAGEHGKICEIDPRNPNPKVRDIAQVRHHVNAMAVASTGERVFVVGQSGLADELDRSGRKVADLLQARGFKTAAGIRAQLVHVADDEHIHRFIFEPATLKPRIRDELLEHLGTPDFPACALAPTLPILAIGTQESTVVLLDTRDLQAIQELDVGSGNSSMVAGVHFLSDNELVVVGGRGEVRVRASGVSIGAIGVTADERKHAELGLAPHGLFQHRSERARFPGDDFDAPDESGKWQADAIEAELAHVGATVWSSKNDDPQAPTFLHWNRPSALALSG